VRTTHVNEGLQVLGYIYIYIYIYILKVGWAEGSLESLGAGLGGSVASSRLS